MKVKVNMNKMALKTLSDAQIKAIGMVAEQMRSEIIQDQVIPFDTGNLQNIATYVDTKEIKKGHVQIVHDTPYATRVYFNPDGFNFQTTFNANARSEWWEEWLTGRKKLRPSTLFKQFYRKLTGGLVK